MTDRFDTAKEWGKLPRVRRYALVHGEPEYRSQMLVRPDGSWVPVSGYLATVRQLLASLEAERAENERLREALKTIARGKYDGIEVTRLSNVECRIIASEALKGEDQ